MPHVSHILEQFKMGDLVDCKVDPSIVKGMPHKYYHGKTGIVYNCNRRTYGVMFYRRAGGKHIERIMHIRVEHLRRSRSNEDAKKRYEEWNKQVNEARAKGERAIPNKRVIEGPREAFIIKRENNTPVEVSDKPYLPIF